MEGVFKEDSRVIGQWANGQMVVRLPVLSGTRRRQSAKRSNTNTSQESMASMTSSRPTPPTPTGEIGVRGTTSNGSSPSGRMRASAMREASPKDGIRTTLMITLMVSPEEYLRVHGPTAPLLNVSARNEHWNLWNLLGPDF